MNIILRVIRVNLPLTEISITRNCKKTRKKKKYAIFNFCHTIEDDCE